MAAATRAVGDEEGNVEGGESDSDGDKEGDGEKEGEGPHSSSSSDRLPPRHMLPLLLRLATAFRAVVAAVLAHGGGDGGRFASTTTTCLGSTVEASSSASSTASPATSTKKNVVEHLSFKIVRTDDVPEYGAACIISCNIASDKCDPMRQM